MKHDRQEVIRQALRAAAAVTGRARSLKHVTRSAAVGATLALCVTGCQQMPTAEEEEVSTAFDASSGQDSFTSAQDATVAPENDATATSSPEVTVSTDISIARMDTSSGIDTVGQSCLKEGALSDWNCCAELGWDTSVPGCAECGWDVPVLEASNCVTCATETDPFGNFECCDAALWDYNKGCQAWGPPAPPVWSGLSLDEILGSAPAPAV